LSSGAVFQTRSEKMKTLLTALFRCEGRCGDSGRKVNISRRGVIPCFVVLASVVITVGIGPGCQNPPAVRRRLPVDKSCRSRRLPQPHRPAPADEGTPDVSKRQSRISDDNAVNDSATTVYGKLASGSAECGAISPSAGGGAGKGMGAGITGDAVENGPGVGMTQSHSGGTGSVIEGSGDHRGKLGGATNDQSPPPEVTEAQRPREKPMKPGKRADQKQGDAVFREAPSATHESPGSPSGQTDSPVQFSEGADSDVSALAQPRAPLPHSTDTQPRPATQRSRFSWGQTHGHQIDPSQIPVLPNPPRRKTKPKGAVTLPPLEITSQPSRLSGRWKQVSGGNEPNFLPGGYVEQSIAFRANGILEIRQVYGKKKEITLIWRIGYTWNQSRNQLILRKDPQHRPSAASLKRFAVETLGVGVLPPTQSLPITVPCQRLPNGQLRLGKSTYVRE